MQAVTQTISGSDQPGLTQDHAAEAGTKRVNTQRVRTIAYWVTTVFGPASFIIGGVVNLLGGPEVVANLQHLGYPAYFASIIGVAKILGSIAVVIPGFPRLKEWAYAGFTFDLLGAAASRVFVGDGVDVGGGAVAPLAFLALVLASWALRPESRKLRSNSNTN
jgi:uncharacterized membrane protein YphA (DoxX/SURF4 family)